MWKRLIFPTVVVAISWICVSGATTYYIYWLNRSYQRVFDENVEAIYASSRLQEVAWKALADVQTGGSAFTSQMVTSTLDVIDREYLKLNRVSFTKPERDLSTALRGQFTDFKMVLGRLLTKSVADDIAARRALVHQLSDVTHRIAATTNSLRYINQKLLLDANDRRDNATTSVFIIRTSVLVLGPGLGIAYGWWMAQRLQRTVARITVTLRDATAGDQSLGAVFVVERTDLEAVQLQVEHVVAQLNQANDALRKARDEVLRSERLAAVGELAAGVAHELRNPLTSVKLLLQHTARRPQSEPLSVAKLQLILDEIARMESTIQGLLDFSRPARLNRLRHDIRESLRRAMNLVVGRSQQLHIEMSADLGTDPLFVNADPEQLHQVFVNLLLNSLESMPQGGRLILEAEFQPTLQCVQVKVRDTGKGIPAEMMKRLFEPFATTKDRGTGLGLAVSRRIVTEHHGTIEAANDIGGGAVFQVTLPAA